MDLKRHGGWKSTSVAESYVEESIGNKVMLCNKILGSGEEMRRNPEIPEPDVSVSTQLESTTSFQNVISRGSSADVLPQISVKNCTNCKIDIRVSRK